MLNVLFDYWCAWRHKPWHRLVARHKSIYFVHCAKCDRHTYQDDRGRINNEPHIPDEAVIEQEWRRRSGD